jgi:hypothetical protein
LTDMRTRCIPAMSARCADLWSAFMSTFVADRVTAQYRLDCRYFKARHHV